MTKDKSKTTGARRTRVDSKENHVLAVIHAQRTILPPADIVFDKGDEVIFNEIIQEFANIDWTPHAIRLAAILTRTIADMQEDQKELRDEGSVLQNDKGNYVMNPRRTACQGYANQIIQLRRTLALHATAGGQKAQVGRTREINKRHQASAPLPSDENGEEGLISLPPAPVG